MGKFCGWSAVGPPNESSDPSLLTVRLINIYFIIKHLKPSDRPASLPVDTTIHDTPVCILLTLPCTHTDTLKVVQGRGLWSDDDHVTRAERILYSKLDLNMAQ